MLEYHPRTGFTGKCNVTFYHALLRTRVSTRYTQPLRSRRTRIYPRRTKQGRVLLMKRKQYILPDRFLPGLPR